MEFLADYGLFLAKLATVVVALLVVAAAVAAVATRHKAAGEDHVEIKHLNQKFDDMAHLLDTATLPKKARKHKERERKKQLKQDERRASDTEQRKRRLYVLNFDGDLRGTQTESLREEITAVLTVATPSDEVLLRLESGGGIVHAYGLAASQLRRIREKKVPLTVAVDEVAASGGYLMACVADKIIAAPFAVIGSIGVLAQIPNFNRLLKKHDVDFEQITAGEYKRTVTLFGETTDKAREKLTEEVQETHSLFKDFVQSQRPGLDVEQVATGEHWLASRAMELGLVDELRTSDDYLVAASTDADIYEVTYRAKHSMIEKLSSLVAAGLRFDHGGSARRTYLV